MTGKKVEWKRGHEGEKSAFNQKLHLQGLGRRVGKGEPGEEVKSKRTLASS